MSLTILVPRAVPSLRQQLVAVPAVVGAEVEGAADVGELAPDVDGRTPPVKLMLPEWPG